MLVEKFFNSERWWPAGVFSDRQSMILVLLYPFSALSVILVESNSNLAFLSFLERQRMAMTRKQFDHWKRCLAWRWSVVDQYTIDWLGFVEDNKRAAEDYVFDRLKILLGGLDLLISSLVQILDASVPEQRTENDKVIHFWAKLVEEEFLSRKAVSSNLVLCMVFTNFFVDIWQRAWEVDIDEITICLR